MQKTLIFIDGQNLFYSLKNMKIMEREINWEMFFSACLEKDDQLIRVYWYQAQKLGKTVISFEKAKRVVEKNSAQKTSQEKNKEASELLQKAEKWEREQIEKYERQLHRYDEMSIDYPKIEMVRKGLVKVDPFNETYLGEKGVDIAIAVNMIRFAGKCDKIILVSGDLDYAEAIQYVKDEMKQVHIVRLYKGNPPMNKSISRELLALADKVIDIYESDIRINYLKKGDSI